MRVFGLRVTALGLFLFMFSGAAFSEEKVVEIVVKGNDYIETPAITSKIRTKVGDELSRRMLSRDVRKLFETGYFSDVYTEGEKVAGGIKLSFVVVENPVIASVKISGNNELASKKLQQDMKLKPGMVYSQKSERHDIYSIRKAYLDKGYYQMTAKIKATPLDDGRVDILVQVNEGDITFIKEIRFIGNEAFTDEELLEPLASRTSNFSSWFSSRDVFNQERFGADVGLLRQFYQDHGFLDARVESLRLMLSPDKKGMYLALSIYEGPKFTVSGIEFQGDIVPSKEELLKDLPLEAGQPYSATKLRNSVMTLTEKVGDEGFAFANVTPLFHRNIKNNTVIVAFEIEKGREVYVERIDISGHTKTKEYVMRREFRQHEGERYSASKVRRTKERLSRLGYIKNPRFTTSEGSTKDKLKAQVEVEEGKSGTFTAGVTYSRLNDLTFTGKVEEQNLFGKGYRVNGSVDTGTVSKSYSLNFVDPYFLSEDISASVSLFDTSSNLQTQLQYDTKSQGGSVGLGFALNEYARYALKYSQTKTTVGGVSPTASWLLRSQVGTNSTGELSQTLSYDTRNNVMSPKMGSMHSATLGYAGLTGDHRFYEIGLLSNNYIPLSDFWTLKGSVKAGVIRGYNDAEVPLFRRYALGGVGSLRGYDYFGVSLVDPVTKENVGGEYKATASLDLMFPLPYMEAAGFRGAFFIDSGTVWGTSGTVTEPFDVNKIRGAYGFGIEWASPVGPITLSWSSALNAQENDIPRRFEFSLGRGF